MIPGSRTERRSSDPSAGLAKRGLLAVPLLVFVGVLMTQLMWAWALPPFRGIDEIDHVFRASSVALGDVRPDHGLPRDGRGALIEVPAKLVMAARAQCEDLDYVGRDNCSAVEALPNGNVLVASGAAVYSPAFYWLVGHVARPFEGTDELYAMRVTASVINAFLIALAAACLRRTSTSGWPIAGLLLGLTPMAVYTTMIPAPNGLELSAAILLWCALLSLQHGSIDRAQPALVSLAGIAGAVMAGVRLTGPILVAMIVSFAVLVAPRRSWEVVRRSAPSTVLASLLVLTATGLHVWWVRTHLPVADNPIPMERSVGTLLGQGMLWMIQSIGAFPFRDQPASPLTYVACGTAVTTLLVLGLREGGPSRWVTVAIILTCILIPMVYTWETMDTRAIFWQGRYGLPLLIGVPIILGQALDRGPRSIGASRSFVRESLVALQAIGSAAAIIHLVANESHRSESANDPNWVQPSPWLVVLVSAFSCACLIAALRRSHAASQSD